MKRAILLLIASVSLFGTISFANAGEQLMVYTQLRHLEGAKSYPTG